MLVGTAAGSSSYSGVMQSSTDGSGSGAVFNISSDAFGNYGSPIIVNPGSGYETSDTINILGSSLGGADGVNDLILQVSSIGVSKSFFTVSQSSSSDIGTGVSFDVSLDGSGNYTVDSLNSRGSNYGVGEVITVSGASLGGDSGTHDLSITVSGLQSNAGAQLYVKDIEINRANQTKTILGGLDISSAVLANDARDVVASALEQVRYRDAYLSSKKNAMVNKAIVDSVPQLKSYYKQQVGLNSLPALSIREIKKNLVISQVMAQAHDARQLINSGIFMLLKEA